MRSVATRDQSELLPTLCAVLVTYLNMVGCRSVSVLVGPAMSGGIVKNPKRGGEQEAAAGNVGNARIDSWLEGKR